MNNDTCLPPSYTAAILVASTKGAAGQRADLSGPAVANMLIGADFEVVETAVVPDDLEALKKKMLKWLDEDRVDLVVTSGGTGLSPSDLTPEATKAIIDREIPGLGEAMRATGLAKTRMAALSRGLAGQRGRGLIINVPGSPKGATESLEAVIMALSHALDKIKGDPRDCAQS